ncbi:unnamed protein product [Ixodes pacificus]
MGRPRRVRTPEEQRAYEEQRRERGGGGRRQTPPMKIVHKTPSECGKPDKTTNVARGGERSTKAQVPRC